MSPTIWHSGEGKTVETGIRGMNRQSKEDFQGSENTLDDIIMMDMCHYTFQIHSIYTTRSKS